MDCLDKILNFNKSKEIKESQEIKIRLYQFLIQLMDDLKNPENIDRVKNCMILLINLFFDVDLIDHYQSRGKSNKELSKNESKEMCELLRHELTNYN